MFPDHRETQREKIQRILHAKRAHAVVCRQQHRTKISVQTFCLMQWAAVYFTTKSELFFSHQMDHKIIRLIRRTAYARDTSSSFFLLLLRRHNQSYGKRCACPSASTYHQHPASAESITAACATSLKSIYR